MELWIVTGSSRGLGRALIERIVQPGRHIVGLARTIDPGLDALARDAGASLQQLPVDLADLAATEQLADRVLADMPRTLSRAVLINNAGIVDPIARQVALHHTDVQRAFAINIGAVMLLTSRFIVATAGVPQRQILNISSGAGRNAMPGWGVYCASKAALDMYTRCLKADADADPTLRVCALAPGVVDTDMQGTIRASGADMFPSVERFRSLKSGGQLQGADETAQRIADFLSRPDFGAVEIDDIRNY